MPLSDPVTPAPGTCAMMGQCGQRSLFSPPLSCPAKGAPAKLVRCTAPLQNYHAKFLANCI
ncbi:hypothetical protein BC828DRAFT_390151 [Blastocladiella britannica]|nr:hypothetical protein BC828DRAFT_390151 [Blastocladiella britannica]